jgi:hypothetical protein
MIEPFLKGRVLETSSTWNSISAVFAQKGQQIHLSNPDKIVRGNLRAYYQGVEAVRLVHSVDLHRLELGSGPMLQKSKRFDTIIVFNAVENGVYDTNVLNNARQLLRPRGRLMLMGPIFTALYDGLELDPHELKKLNHRSLRQVLTDEMEIIMTHYIDLPTDVAYDRSGPSVIVIARKEGKFTYSRK